MTTEDIDSQNIKSKVRKLLAEYLGLESEDIKYEDSLQNDLHMLPSDITDFQTTLEANSIDTSKIDLTEIETLEDLCENLV